MRKIQRRAVVTIVPLLLLAGGWLLGAADPVRAGRATGEALYRKALRLAHENACRRMEAELAKGERFYLVLDPVQRVLRLKLRGALLHELPLDSIEVGRPHRFFVERGTGIHARGQLHRRGRLEPRRPQLRLPVEIPEDADEPARTIMLPPEPETAIAVPRRFFVRYEDGVVLEFRTGEGGLDLGRRIVESFSTLFEQPELRLHLVLDSAAAETFYRSVPAETDLLVL